MSAAAPTTITGPLPPSLGIVTFDTPALTTVAPNVHAVTWSELSRRLTHHRRRASKNGEGWSPAVYRRDEEGRPLTRANGSVEGLTCAVADLDHIELDDIRTLTDHVKALGLAGALYSTFSHTVTAPRVRLVIPFTEPVPADLWRRLWPALNETIYLRLADRAASDPSRMYFLPATPGDETTIAECWDGLALDWRTLPLSDPEMATSPTPVETSAKGPAETVEPEDMPILEQLFSGRHAGKRMKAWFGDYADFGGNASSADQSIANGLVAYCRGDVERAERIMRAGAWRPKWDERRGSTTWLGYTLGKALAAYRAWVGHQDAEDEPEAGSAPVSADETLKQKAIRLERELQQERTAHATTRGVVAVQVANLRAARAKIEDQAGFLTHIGDVIAKPNEEISPAEKVVSIGLLIEIHFRADASPYKLPDGTEGSYRLPNGKVRMTRNIIALRTGYSPDQASTIARQIAKRENAPYGWGTRREWGVRQDGSEGWIRKIEIEPRTERTADSLRAMATLTALPGKPKHGGSQAAVEARERARRGDTDTCEHPEDDVLVSGTCAAGACPLGDRRLTAQEWEGLKRQDDGLEQRHPTVDGYIPMGQQDDVLDELAERRAQAAQAIPLKRSPDPWKRPRPPDEGSNLGQIKMTDRGAGVFDTPEDTPHAIAVDVGPPEASPDWLEQWPDDPPTQAAPLVPGDQLAWWSRRPPPAIKGAER